MEETCCPWLPPTSQSGSPAFTWHSARNVAELFAFVTHVRPLGKRMCEGGRGNFRGFDGLNLPCLSHLSTRVGFGDKTINCIDLMAGSMDNMIQILIVIIFSLDSNQTGDNFKVTLWIYIFFLLKNWTSDSRSFWVFLQPGLQTPAGQTIDYSFLVPLQWLLLISLRWICFNGQCVVIKL